MALLIDADEYLTGSGFDPSATTELTLAAWVKLSNTTGWKAIAALDDNIAGNAGTALLSVNGTSFDHWFHPATARRLDGSGTASTSVWQLVVMTYNSATPMARSYINSTLRTTYTTSGHGAYSATSNEVHIGYAEYTTIGSPAYFRGRIAHVAMWNKELTSTDVAALYNGGSGGNGASPTAVQAENLVFYAPLEDDETVHTGGITLSAVGSPTFDADNPTVDAPSGGDVTAPVLSSPTGTATGSTTATLGATTDEGNGTLYWVVTTSATEPSAAQVKLGNDHADAAAAYADSDAVGSTGAKTNNATGLTASTAYHGYAMHEDAAANQSDVLYLGTFTTTAANAAPSWSGTPSAMSSKRGQALTPQDITSLVSDADLDTLTYTITGAPTGVTIHSSTGIISGTPTAAPGVYACTVEADDGIASPVASSSFNITVQQAALALNAAGYEFGDGNAAATMAVVASTELQVAVYPLTEWPPASAIATATATTGTNGRLADLGDDDLSHGTTYRVIARNAADGETWAWTMAAS